MSSQMNGRNVGDSLPSFYLLFSNFFLFLRFTFILCIWRFASMPVYTHVYSACGSQRPEKGVRGPPSRI